MEKLIRDTLILLNLTDKEIRFFETAFQLGDTTINEVAMKSRLERSTAYLIAQDLIKKGFLEEDYKTYRKKIIPITPQKLLQKLATKQRSMRRQEMELEEKLPELNAFYKTSEVQPHVKVYEGKQALFSLWQDVLQTQHEILLWTNQKTESLFFSRVFHEKFIEERIKKAIPIRALVVNNELGKKLQDTDTASLRKSKLLPLKTSFHAETYIYDSKVAILDYKKDILGIIIESTSIASTQRAIFQMVWSLV